MNNRNEARRQGIPLGHYRTQLLMEALQRNAGTITVAKMYAMVSLHANIFATLYQ